MEQFNQLIELATQFVKAYGLLTVVGFIVLVLIWFMIKNFFSSEKNIHKKVLFNFDGEKTEFELEKTETKKIAYIERKRQGEKIELSGGSVYEVSYFIYPDVGLIKKITNWDKKYITLKIEPK
ncbi:hypothetical protein PWF75_03365 [Streptococcus suis]|uniref:hypothetical protein n=1 Tax=Streptococcus suis TaxID=1307 RepID=UPI001552596F|nr:hypothetical protein [Streptococcus suis]MDE1693821.1 hypothetical protein [Streptococcus suis]NQP40077.1 hypothetical protein [Streptococcus suis]